MCNCHSYNWDIGTEPEVILDPRDYTPFPITEELNKTICIDACIAEQIKMLWENGIWTKGCCCGHNRENPSVIIGLGATPEKAKQLLKKHDPERAWNVLQWQLITT